MLVVVGRQTKEVGDFNLPKSGCNCPKSVAKDSEIRDWNILLALSDCIKNLKAFEKHRLTF